METKRIKVDGTWRQQECAGILRAVRYDERWKARPRSGATCSIQDGIIIESRGSFEIDDAKSAASVAGVEACRGTVDTADAFKHVRLANF